MTDSAIPAPGESPAAGARERGALVLSLDFELHWGVFDVQPPDGPYRANLLGARQAVPAMLDIFAERGVGATWATVGLLMARSRAEAERLRPAVRPAYRDPRLDPYAVPVGEDEDDDPLHYAPSLVARIAATPGQELATHTFGHVYGVEPGMTREAFAADLAAAREAARPFGAPLRSLVPPRNQHNPAFDGVLREAGIVAYRGNARGRVYRPMRLDQETRGLRVARRLDAYLPMTGAQGWSWRDLRPVDGLCNVPASLLLRPFLPGSPALNALSLRRAQRVVEAAARGRRVAHLWWHPHNFGVNLDENLARLRALLDTFAACRARWGMRSLTMAQAAEAT